MTATLLPPSELVRAAAQTLGRPLLYVRVPFPRLGGLEQVLDALPPEVVLEAWNAAANGVILAFDTEAEMRSVHDRLAPHPEVMVIPASPDPR